MWISGMSANQFDLWVHGKSSISFSVCCFLVIFFLL